MALYGARNFTAGEQTITGNVTITGDISGDITLPAGLKITGDLIVDTPNATVTNEAQVTNGNIIIKDVSKGTWIEKSKGNKIDFQAAGKSLVIDDDAEVASLTLNAKGANVKINKTAKVSKVLISKALESIEITPGADVAEATGSEKEDFNTKKEAAEKEELKRSLTDATEYKYEARDEDGSLDKPGTPVEGNYRPLNVYQVNEKTISLKSDIEYSSKGVLGFTIENDSDLIANFAIKTVLSENDNITPRSLVLNKEHYSKLVEEGNLKSKIEEYEKNSLSRYLGALGYMDNSPVKSIKLDEKTYTWDSKENKKGSNWVSGDDALVDDITNESVELTLIGENDVELTGVKIADIETSTEENVKSSLKKYKKHLGSLSLDKIKKGNGEFVDFRLSGIQEKLEEDNIGIKKIKDNLEKINERIKEEEEEVNETKIILIVKEVINKKD